MNEFAGKTVVVTGAARGIGLGISRAFALRGANVVLNDIEAELAEEAVSRLNRETESRRVAAFPADMSDTENGRRIVEFCRERFGTPHIGVANAGITRFVRFVDYSPEVFEQVVAVNLRGTFFLAQALAREMISRGTAGRLLLLSSAVGLRGFPNFSAYSMTKAGVASLARSIALELGPFGITANAISPGATLTERTQLDDPNYARNWGTVNITQRVGTVEDVAACACFLASEGAGQITGQNILVDGGWSIRGVLPTDHPELPEPRD